MEEHFKKIDIPDGHRLVGTGMKALGGRKGQDTDLYFYDEVNVVGEVVASYEVSDSTGIYPPHCRTISAKKVC